MSASKLNLPAIEKGATYRHTLYWKDSSNVAINLTNCTAKLQVRETIDSASPLLELSTVNLGLVITPLLGKIDLYISNETTAVLIGTGGVYDLEIYFNNGDTTRLVEGKVVFKAEVTR
jgi:hypothetical protein